MLYYVLLNMREFYIITDVYMGEKMDDKNFPRNFVNGFNAIMFKGTILVENISSVSFYINKIINFESKYNTNVYVPEVGDVIKMELDENYDEKNDYYRICVS